MSKAFVSFMPAVTVAITAGSNKALTSACDVGRNKIETNLSGSRSGHVYRVPGTSVMYTASAPGEFPAVRLGDLKGSINFERSGASRKIGTQLDYGLALEKKPVSKGGRPWLKRSLDQAKPAMIVEVNKRWF